MELTQEEVKAKIDALLKKSAKLCHEQCPPREVFFCWCGYALYSEKGFDRHLEMHTKHRDYDIPDLTNGSTLPHPWSFQNTKKLVYKRDKSICRSCGCELNSVYEVHHIKPRSQGGSDHPANLVLLCLHCHNITKRGHNRFGGVPFANISKLDAFNEHKTERYK